MTQKASYTTLTDVTKTFFCGDNRRRFNERTGIPFNDLQFPTVIVLLAVLWRLRYKLGLLAVSKSGTAMIFPGFPGSSLTRNGTGAMPST